MPAAVAPPPPEAGLSDAERALVAAIAAREEELVALVRELIGFDTTTRRRPGDPAREEAALQAALAARLRAAGAEVDVWEPAPADVAGHPLAGGETYGFAGRPQLAARFRGAGGRRSVLLNGHIDVVPAAREDGWEHDPFDARVRDEEVVGRGACDMKGGIAAMIIAAEALAAAGAPRGDVVVCTGTDEESSGVGALACARRGVRADAVIVPEPTGLEVWPVCRGSVYGLVEVPGRAGHVEREQPGWREGGAVNAIDKARHFLAGVDRLRAEWRSRPTARHPLLDPPDVVASCLVADSGWDVTLPDRAELTLAVLILPAQADADGWTAGVRSEVEAFLRRWCEADPWLAAHPPRIEWHTECNPSETPADAPSVRALVAANAALGLRTRLGGSGRGTTARRGRSRPARPRSCTARPEWTAPTPWASRCRSTASSAAPRRSRSPCGACAADAPAGARSPVADRPPVTIPRGSSARRRAGS